MRLDHFTPIKEKYWFEMKSIGKRVPSPPLQTMKSDGMVVGDAERHLSPTPNHHSTILHIFLQHIITDYRFYAKMIRVENA